MVTRNSNALITNAAAPENGYQYSNVMSWFGGPIDIRATGAFDGATVEVLLCAHMPKIEDGDYAGTLTDADWTELHTFTEPGHYEEENLNPCWLVARVSDSGEDTRASVILL